MNSLTRLTERIDPLASFFDNRMNPLLVRELRQLVRNRFILVMLNLYIGILVFTGLLTVGFGSEPTRAVGGTFFGILLWLNGITAFCVIIPYTIFTTAVERINDDLMYTSAIRPWNIVWGKFLNGVILSLLLFSVTCPFYMLAHQLRGLDILGALTAAWAVFLSLHFLNAAAIFIFSGVRTYVQLITWLILSLIGLFVLLAWYVGAFHFHFGGFYFFPHLLTSTVMRSGFWQFTIVFTFLISCLIAILLSASIIHVASPAASRSTPMRLTVTAVYLLTFLAALCYKDITGTQQGIRLWCNAVFIAVFPLFIVAVCERDHFGVRLRDTIPHNLLLRFLAFPFTAGALGGIIWTVILLAGAAWIGLVLRPTSDSWFTSAGNMPVFSLFFLFDYAVTALLLRSFFFRNAIRHQMTWLPLCLLVVFLCIGGATCFFFLEMRHTQTGIDFSESLFSAAIPTTWDYSGEFTSMQIRCATTWAVLLLPFFMYWSFRQLRRFVPLPNESQVPSHTEKR